MTSDEDHVSMFELDLFFATREQNAALEAHVAACERCAGYLKELATLQETREVPRRASAGRSRRRPWLVPIAAALAAAAVFAPLLQQPVDDPLPSVAVKGSPAVQLLVRRGEATRIWDGNSRVQAGDVLGLRVACEEFSALTVAAAAGEAWKLLEQQPCAARGAQILPFTLVVDAAPGRERFAVVFSAAALEGRALSEAVLAQRRDASVWVTRFELEKEPRP